MNCGQCGNYVASRDGVGVGGGLGIASGSAAGNMRRCGFAIWRSEYCLVRKLRCSKPVECSSGGKSDDSRRDQSVAAQSQPQP
jgi:hypothetical protein